MEHLNKELKKAISGPGANVIVAKLLRSDATGSLTEAQFLTSESSQGIAANLIMIQI